MQEPGEKKLRTVTQEFVELVTNQEVLDKNSMTLRTFWAFNKPGAKLFEIPVISKMVKFHSFLHRGTERMVWPYLGTTPERQESLMPILHPAGQRQWRNPNGNPAVPYLLRCVLSTQSVIFYFSPNWKLRSKASQMGELPMLAISI